MSIKYIENKNEIIIMLEKARKRGKIINTVQIHHSYNPDYSMCDYIFARDNSFRKLIDSIYYYHTKTMKWGDIGYNIIITPKGTIWKGRDFEKNPYGIVGNNENSFAICLIGNFDRGNDQLRLEQKATLIDVLRDIISVYSLDKNKTIVYHREFAPKSCPGSGFIAKPELIGML